MFKDITNQSALLFVLITVMINAIGFGLMIPILPSLLKELTGLSNSEAAIHGGWLTFVFALMQFIFMPIMGALSDRYGRRLVMILSLFGLSLDYFILAFAPTIAFLYLGRILAGALGATFSTANAYIADISPPETRAQNFGLVGAMFGIGFMIGPFLGGVLGDHDIRLPFIAAGIISFLNVIFGYFVLPETLSEDNRRPFKWSRANPLGTLLSIGRMKGALGLIFVLFLLHIAHTVYPSTYTFSMMEGLNWSEKMVGYSLAAFGVASIIVQGVLIRIILPKTGLFWAGIIGIVSTIIAYSMMGYGRSGWVIYAAGPFAAFAGFYTPALTNMMSSRLGQSQQGELQGAIGAVQGLAMMIGPLMMVYIFNMFGDKTTPPYEPGAPFYLAATLSIIAIITYLMVTTAKDRTRTLPTEGTL